MTHFIAENTLHSPYHVYGTPYRLRSSSLKRVQKCSPWTSLRWYTATHLLHMSLISQQRQINRSNGWNDIKHVLRNTSNKTFTTLRNRQHIKPAVMWVHLLGDTHNVHYHGCKYNDSETDNNQRELSNFKHIK